jgi:ribonuclease HII
MVLSMIYQDLNKKINENGQELQVGTDEAGRGNLIGPIFAGAVVWSPDFKHDKLSLIKDSKKLSSKKREKMSRWIKKNALAWAVASCSAEEIDAEGIGICNFKAMHLALDAVHESLDNNNKFQRVLVDGSHFPPYILSKKTLDKTLKTDEQDDYKVISSSNLVHLVHHVCIPQGDNKYLAIAAASILAKQAQTEWIIDLCDNKDLNKKYNLLKNMGYGTKEHIEGIKDHGYTKWHRRSFKIKSLQPSQEHPVRDKSNNKDLKQSLVFDSLPLGVSLIRQIADDDSS